MAKDFHDDYEYFKMFLKKTIPHSEIVEGLFQLDSVEQLASIIHYLQTGEKHSTKPSSKAWEDRMFLEIPLADRSSSTNRKRKRTEWE